MRLVPLILFPIVSVVVSAQTNAPAPAITGIEMVDSVIHASPIVLVAIAIQLVGVAITKTEFIPNKALPLLNLVMGGASYPAAIGQWSFKNVLLGILAGAGATGVYEVFKQFRPPPNNPPAQIYPPDPKPPTT